MVIRNETGASFWQYNRIKSCHPANATISITPKAQVNAVDDKDRKRREAEERQRLSAIRKPIEARIKRLEEQMAKLNLKKDDFTRQLSEPSIYDDANKETLKNLVLNQAYVSKELEQLEMEWLEQQELLEVTQ